MQALGLIEVVGYPPAVEAADAALKAANVTLLSIAKADAGIMTVEIIGDVGAVTSAVDAAARSAARIGLVRARHIIPRVEAELIGKVIPYERTLNEQVKPVERKTTIIDTGIQESKKPEEANIEEIRIEELESDKAKREERNGAIGSEESINKGVKTKEEKINEEKPNRENQNVENQSEKNQNKENQSEKNQNEKNQSTEIQSDEKLREEKPNEERLNQAKLNEAISEKDKQEKAEEKSLNEKAEKENKIDNKIEDKAEIPNIDKVTKSNEDTKKQQELLSKRSNANLRNMIVSRGIQVPTEQLNAMKKQDLIQVLLAYEKEHGK